ncbi:hypothetical protein BC834DRAFT_845056 [Gloeopeniophorella convolvens]|nr:hypothetical protein BC834DRAFT_845056 [Gloeopeniophorella convolvens]
MSQPGALTTPHEQQQDYATLRIEEDYSSYPQSDANIAHSIMPTVYQQRSSLLMPTHSQGYTDSYNQPMTQSFMPGSTSSIGDTFQSGRPQNLVASFEQLLDGFGHGAGARQWSESQQSVRLSNADFPYSAHPLSSIASLPGLGPGQVDHTHLSPYVSENPIAHSAPHRSRSLSRSIVFPAGVVPVPLASSGTSSTPETSASPLSLASRGSSSYPPALSATHETNLSASQKVLGKRRQRSPSPVADPRTPQSAQSLTISRMTTPSSPQPSGNFSSVSPSYPIESPAPSSSLSASYAAPASIAEQADPSIPSLASPAPAVLSSAASLWQPVGRMPTIQVILDIVEKDYSCGDNEEAASRRRPVQDVRARKRLQGVRDINAQSTRKLYDILGVDPPKMRRDDLPELVCHLATRLIEDIRVSEGLRSRIATLEVALTQKDEEVRDVRQTVASDVSHISVDSTAAEDVELNKDFTISGFHSSAADVASGLHKSHKSQTVLERQFDQLKAKMGQQSNPLLPEGSGGRPESHEITPDTYAF